MIVTLSSQNKDSFIIPSKIANISDTEGTWTLKIKSFKVNDIEVTYDSTTFSDEDYSLLLKLNQDFIINGRHLFVFSNSRDIKLGERFRVILGTGHTPIFHIHSESQETIQILFDILKEEEVVLDGTIFNNKNVSAKKINYNKIGTALENRKSSFGVLRTNPKLSGNIKLVVDSSNNMFLDTFKVSNKLTEIQYRHAKVSGEGSLATDIRNVFSSLPKGELYKIADDNLEAHKQFTDYNNQIDTTYHYGARTNQDQLYKENFSILAPLWINQILPDFFAIFRIDDFYNVESYSEKINDKEIFNKFLKEGKLVKLFDMRKSSPLGVYLYNHYNEISEYPGSTYLQFVEQEQKDESINWQGKNSWIGISVNKGIIVKKTETSYFANQILNEGEGVQEKFNAFLIDGFERNNLVSANLINLEFMFDDEEAEPYKMYRYFGLYLKENDFLTYQFIDKKYDNETQSEKIFKYDSSLNIVDDSFLLDATSGIINQKEYENRLIFAISPNEGIRMKNESDLTYFLKNTIANKPYQNIGSYDIDSVEKKHEEFMVLNFTESLKPGEHLRICVPSYREKISNKINSLIFEIVLSSDKRLKTVDGVFPYVVYNKMGILADDNHAWYRDQIIRKYPDDSDLDYYGGLITQSIKDFPYFEHAWYVGPTNMSQVKLPKDLIDYPNVFRLSVYAYDFEDSSKIASIEEQIRRIAKAINRFSEMLKVQSYDKSSISILSDFRNTYFQRISSQIINEENLEDSIKYFGNYKIKVPLRDLNFDSLKYSANDFLFAPLDFELFGDRKTSIVKFVSLNNLYQIKVNNIDQIRPITLYKGTSGTFRQLSNFEIKSIELDFSYEELSSRKEHKEYVNILQSPYDLTKNVIQVPENVWIEQEKINTYSSYPCFISLMGILSIKDFESYINYSKSQEVASNVRLAAKAGSVISIGVKDKIYLERLKMYKLVSGKFENISLSAGNNFYIIGDQMFYSGTIGIISEKIGDSIVVESDAVISDVEGSQLEYKFSIKSPSLSEIYYYKNLDDPSSNLKYPLITPTITNWESVGNYYDNDNVLNTSKLLSNYNKETTKKDGFLSIVKSYIGDIYHNQYVKSKLDYLIENNKKTETFKEYLLDPSSLNNTINTYLTDEVSPYYSIGYYNKYVNTLEFIICGLKFSLSFNSANNNNNIRLSEYNNYTIFLLNDYNNSKNEFIINTRERIILFINHQFDFGNFKKMDTLLVQDPSNGNMIYEDSYNVIKSPFQLKISGAFGNLNSVKIPLQEKYQGTIDSSILYQLDKFELPNDFLDGENIAGYFDNDIIQNVTSEYVVVKNGNEFINNYNNSGNDMKFGFIDPSLNNANFMTKHTFLVDPSIHTTEDLAKSEYETFMDSYIESFSKDMDIYIKNDTQTIKIEQSKDYQPLIMKVSRPKNIKFNYGYFTPKFIDMLDFDLNETSLVDICKTDFNSCNTSFKDIDSIKNFYCSKVYNETSNLYLKKNYFVVPEFSLVCSDWDKSFYRLYTSENSYDSVNGVVPGIEDTTFFGSKCIKVKDKENVIVTDWSYTDCMRITQLSVDQYSSTQKSVTYNSKEVSFNLTLGLYNYFINNKAFLENWKDFEYNNTYIKNYIKNCLQKYFKIDQKRNFKIFVKSSNGTSEFFDKIPEDISEYEELTNFKSVYIEDNEDIICKVTIDDWNNKNYFAILNLNNKED